MNIICPDCATTGTIGEDLVPDGGKVVVCPKCRSKFKVTKVPSKAGPVALSTALPTEEKVRVTCSACGASGSLPAARIGPGGTTITCPKCKARFVVKAADERPPTPRPKAPAPASPGGETVPYRCPQCGREGAMPGRLVPEGGTGANCPGCNARFFVRRPGEQKPDIPAGPPARPLPAYDGAVSAISASPGPVGPSVIDARPLSPSGTSYGAGPAITRARAGAGSAAAGVSLDEMWAPSLGRGMAGGAGAAFVGSMVWAFITVITSYQIGWMAIGVGALVGFAVKFFGRGTDQTYGFVGAGLAFFGCVTGNLMAACAFISADPRNPGFMTIFFDALGSPGTAIRVMAAAFQPLDILFYILAITTGYKVALTSE